MPALTTPGIHHITMVSSDARRTLAFYRDVLGLGMVKRTVNFDDPDTYHLYFGDEIGRPGTILTFFEWPASPRGGWGVGGVHHLALGTATAESQLKWKRWLERHAVAVAGPFNRGYFRSIYFTDPDGQILEIATKGPGYAIDEPADRLGESLKIPPDAELRGARDEDAIRARNYGEPVEHISADMRLDGIHHISGITDDVEQAHAFLTRALGLRRVKQSVNQDDGKTPHWFWAHYEAGTVAPHSAYTLFGWGATSTHRARGGVGQTHHVAFRAKDEEEQLAWREHLLSLEVDVTPVLDRQYFKSIYFRSPDGQLLEIATDGPGFLVDEEPEALGQLLKLPAWLEGRREEIERELVPLGTHPRDARR